MGGVGDQLLGTALLAISICTVTDRKNVTVRGDHMVPGKNNKNMELNNSM